MTTTGDYVLGTQNAEIQRLGLQHRVWREHMLGAWRRAGIQPSWRVLDVGAGPGYATQDLTEIVGELGQVTAIERSQRFVDALESVRLTYADTNIDVVHADLMEHAPLAGFDMTWCRWVASFAPSVPTLIDFIRHSLKPGGIAVFHEYVDYASWKFAPSRAHLEDFVRKVMESWRAMGGEPDIAPVVVDCLQQQGFRVKHARPLVFTASPSDMTWQWPAGFVESYAKRLHEIGLVSLDWVHDVVDELRIAESDPRSLMITPMVLEIVAERIG